MALVSPRVYPEEALISSMILLLFIDIELSWERFRVATDSSDIMVEVLSLPGFL